MEFVHQIIDTTITSFDFAFCIAANVLTYLLIKTIDECNGERPVKTWTKRFVLLAVIIFLSILYIISGSDLKLIINSAILAPVFWSWIGKPICAHFNIDYRKEDNL
jgi:uncharacterized membrane protein